MGARLEWWSDGDGQRSRIGFSEVDQRIRLRTMCKSPAARRFVFGFTLRHYVKLASNQRVVKLLPKLAWKGVGRGHWNEGERGITDFPEEAGNATAGLLEDNLEGKVFPEKAVEREPAALAWPACMSGRGVKGRRPPLPITRRQAVAQSWGQ
jgi:hypothetical protein